MDSAGGGFRWVGWLGDDCNGSVVVNGEDPHGDCPEKRILATENTCSSCKTVFKTASHSGTPEMMAELSREAPIEEGLWGDFQVHATSLYRVSPHFLENDIRVKPDLDALGTLGDTGWYCIRAILWATNYDLPKTARALRKPTYNEAGVILSCEASLLWEDDRIATFYCSFLSDMSMDITAMGTKGSLRVHDYIIPNEEKEALFYTNSNSYFVELSTGWAPKPSECAIHTDLPQEVVMVREFARLVGGIRFGNEKPENKWPSISRKTQVVVDAVKASIDNGLEPVHILE